MIVIMIVVMMMIIIRMCIMNTYNDYENDASQKRSLLHRQIVASSCPKIDLPIFQWIFNGHFLEKQPSKHRRIMETRSWCMSLLQLKRRFAPLPGGRACVCLGGRAEQCSLPGLSGAELVPDQIASVVKSTAK